MARKSQHTFSKRQREQKKAEKAAQKRARRAGPKEPSEPLPETEAGQELVGEDDAATPESESTPAPAPE